MNKVKVSVVVTTYNSEMYLSDCLYSIINQSLKEIEIIIVDDGSTDNTLDIVYSFAKQDNRIKYYSNIHANAGRARNLGMKYAKGKYLLFLDSDDFFNINMFEDLYNQAETDGSDIVVCEYDYYDECMKKINDGFRFAEEPVFKSPFSASTLTRSLFTITNPAAWNKLFLKDFIKNNSLYFEDLKSTNDLTFTYSAMASAKK